MQNTPNSPNWVMDNFMVARYKPPPFCNDPRMI